MLLEFIMDRETYSSWDEKHRIFTDADEPNGSEVLLTDDGLLDLVLIEVFGRLDAAHWSSYGGLQMPQQIFGMRCTFDPGERVITGDEVAPSLPVRDDKGQLLPGFVVGTDEDTGTAFVSYEGPFNDTVRQVIDAMVEIGQPTVDPLQ